MTSSTERNYANISRSQLIAFATIFTALYFVLSYSVSIVIGPLLRGSGAHFFRAFCMVLIAAKLRSPNGCDWDRVQTHKSLIPYLLGETYEVIEAINNNDYEALKEELGDLLLHIVSQAELASEKKKFKIK